MAASSTWRVVAAAFFTSPKRLSRKRVRISEVLPVLVWPTTARESGFMDVLFSASSPFESDFTAKHMYQQRRHHQHHAQPVPDIEVFV